MLKESSHALVIRIEVDSSSLHGEGRPEVMRLLHEITAAVEIEAKRVGFTESAGFAGGSCKPSFCSEHNYCQVVSGLGACRHPDVARPSLSGFGVNVGELMKSAGWSTSLFPQQTTRNEEQMAWVAGLILLR
jgi:predicted metal-binding protein